MSFHIFISSVGPLVYFLSNVMQNIYPFSKGILKVYKSSHMIKLEVRNWLRFFYRKKCLISLLCKNITCSSIKHDIMRIFHIFTFKTSPPHSGVGWRGRPREIGSLKFLYMYIYILMGLVKYSFPLGRILVSSNSSS